MKSIFYKADTRGHANYGWLDTYYSFSFNRYYDPQRVNFGALRVLNDDTIAAGGGFGKHPHDNMEIVTIPFSGALEHQDSTGHSEVLRPDDVQIMSAGSGIIHSEFNHSKTDACSLFQVWIMPDKRDIKPRYDQKSFNSRNRQNRWQLLVGPDNENGELWINQQARFSRGDFDAATEVKFELKRSGSGLFLMVIEGSVETAGQLLERRDAIGISETSGIDIRIRENAQLLAIEVPM